ncbi:hypothetical protein A1O3_04108 [Capronia epimyces CBS 606.96]|uniref:Uncharacterized protein n=1 Tax=Capronia epimyces CBS 606.96 TaxID=1182542 RepID=W9YXX1_9EURO|nr:uncharacterized protein A1O3_04108 [Capronia epimyces CBS 606.96]EXJ87149.1 hypothetical protein A1O3_04108 [Capronia epimyces CBS 606.96]
MGNQLGEPEYVSAQGVQLYSPPWCYKPTGTWSMMSKRGNTLYISGLRGICPETSELVPIVATDEDEGPSRESPAYPRVLKAFQNMQMIIEAAGASLGDCLRLVVYTTDMPKYRPLVNEAQKEIWGDVPFPPRSIVEVSRLNQDDIVEVESTFAIPA